MKILGLETSCDETAAAVVQDGRKLLSNVIYSQIDLHKEFGGVVPEVAARSHIETILPVIEKALSRAKTSWDNIDAIATTYGPGLPGALLVGVTSARTLALAKNKPLIPVNHVHAHIYANWLLKIEPVFPVLALVVSGGHSQLVLLKDHTNYQLLGQTQDDAIGEAFDKVSKMLGLGYPGGPAIAQAASKGNPYKYSFPTAKLAGRYDFSFSGLKTAVLRQLQLMVKKDYTFPSFKLSALLSHKQKIDVAASFQRVAVETLVDVTLKAYKDYLPKTVVIAGGVASNLELRKALTDKLPIAITYAPAELCTDNAAMIASLGYYQSQQPSANIKFANPLELESVPSLSM